MEINLASILGCALWGLELKCLFGGLGFGRPSIGPRVIPRIAPGLGPTPVGTEFTVSFH